MNRLLSAFSLKQNFKLLLIRPNGNSASLDGLRAISMLLVLLFHSFAIFAVLNPKIITLTALVEQCGWSWGWVWNADKGVDIFFVLSGFLITGILLRQIDNHGKIMMKQFYWRRFLRLSPVYYAVIALYAWLCIAGNVTGANLEYLWANVLYINNFLPYENMAMNWTWSLAIEEQYYLLFPVFLLFAVKKNHKPLTWLWVLYALSFIISFAVIMSDDIVRETPGSKIVSTPELHAHHFSVFYDKLYTRFGPLIAGAIAAWYSMRQPEKVAAFFGSFKGQSMAWGAFVMVVFLMSLPVLTQQFDNLYWTSIFYQTAARNLFAAGVAVLILAMMEKGLLSRLLNLVFSNPVWHPFAQLSYSMYLLHVLVITLAASAAGQAMLLQPEIYTWTPFQAVGMVFLVSVIVSTVIAVILYLLIERPIMNLRK